MPLHSFSAVVPLEAGKEQNIHRLGEVAAPTASKPYYQIALRVRMFENLVALSSASPQTDTSIALCYFVPAFLFPARNAPFDIRDLMRSRVRSEEVTFNARIIDCKVDKGLQGWIHPMPPTVSEVATAIAAEANFSLDSDAIRGDIFKTCEVEMQRNLILYQDRRQTLATSRAVELLACTLPTKHQEPNTADTCPKMPPWWPTRLLDVNLGAILPGENVWYFKGKYNTLSYRWAPAGQPNETWFSNQSVQTTLSGDFADFLRKARGLRSSEFIWIDALCINQKDPDDVAREIKRASEYYRQCQDCLVLPSGLSETPSRLLLSGESLPPWFSRGWTMQEAALPQNLVFDFQEGWLDRHGVLSQLDRNRSQSGLLINTARRILRREALASLAPNEVIHWAMGRESEQVEDLIYGAVGLLNSAKQLAIVYYDGLRPWRFRQTLLKLAAYLSPRERTALVALASCDTSLEGPTWLPRLPSQTEEMGILIEGSTESQIQEDHTLLLQDAKLLKIKSIESSPPLIDFSLSRRFRSPSCFPKLERWSLHFSGRSSSARLREPADNVTNRVWLAMTYLGSAVCKICFLDDIVMIGRVIYMEDPAPTHLIELGKSFENLHAEHVYACGVLEGGKFRKVGLIARPDDDTDECPLQHREKRDIVIV